MQRFLSWCEEKNEYVAVYVFREKVLCKSEADFETTIHHGTPIILGSLFDSYISSIRRAIHILLLLLIFASGRTLGDEYSYRSQDAATCYLPNPHLFLVPLFQEKEFIAKGLL